jgi:histidyl-tRNA synthetase
MNKNINTQTMPGFMELLPNEQIAFNKMLQKIKEVYTIYGFRPIETPILERAEVLLAKGGGDTDKEIYRFKKGSNDIALRFDLTVPLARYVAQHQNDLVFPFKVGNIGKVYRGEKPQSGRFREFYQCDTDIIGRDELDISFDAEIVSLIYALLTNLGFDDFTIRINNRKVMNGLFRSLEIQNTGDVLRIIDKLEKENREEIIEEFREMKLSTEKIDKIFEVIEIKDDVINSLKKLEIGDEDFWEGLEELEYVCSRVKDLGIKKENFEIDLSISRGLDYYTGTVYETFLNKYPEFGSICSGGRYDNLTSYYTDNKFPGVGCSIGLTRLFDCLLKNDEIDVATETTTEVLVIAMEGFDSYGLDIGSKLRFAGVNTEVVFGLKGSFKYADRLNIPYVVIVGEEEINQDKYALKDMKSGDQTLLGKEKLIEEIKDNLKLQVYQVFLLTS